MTKALLAIIRRQIAEVAKDEAALPEPPPEQLAATLRSISQLLEHLASTHWSGGDRAAGRANGSGAGISVPRETGTGGIGPESLNRERPESRRTRMRSRHQRPVH